jgi:hypothetical protein
MCTSMRLPAHFGQWLEVVRRGRKVYQWQVAAELLSGQVKKSYRRRKLVRVTHVMRLGNRGCSRGRLTGIGSLRTAEHRFYRAGESDGPTWRGSAGPPDLGDGAAVPIPVGSFGVVAGLLSFCAPPRSAVREAWAAASARGQPSGVALSAPDPCHGSRQNPSTMDGA